MPTAPRSSPCLTLVALITGCLRAPAPPAVDGDGGPGDGAPTDGPMAITPCGPLGDTDELPFALVASAQSGGTPTHRLVRAGTCGGRPALVVVEPKVGFDPDVPDQVIALDGPQAGGVVRALAAGPDHGVLVLTSTSATTQVLQIAPSGIVAVVADVDRALAAGTPGFIAYSALDNQLAFGAGAQIWRTPLSAAPGTLMVPTRDGPEVLLGIVAQTNLPGNQAQWLAVGERGELALSATLGTTLTSFPYIAPCVEFSCGRSVQPVVPEGDLADIVAITTNSRAEGSVIYRDGNLKRSLLAPAETEPLASATLVLDGMGLPTAVVTTAAGTRIGLGPVELAGTNPVYTLQWLDIPDGVAAPGVLAAGTFDPAGPRAYVLATSPTEAGWRHTCVDIGANATCP